MLKSLVADELPLVPVDPHPTAFLKATNISIKRIILSLLKVSSMTNTINVQKELELYKKKLEQQFPSFASGTQTGICFGNQIGSEKNLKRTVAIAKKASTKQTSPKLYLKRACSACAAYFLCGFNVTIITTFVQTCEIYQFFSENHCKSTILTLKLQWLVIGLKEKFEIQDYDNSGYRLEAQQVWALN